MEEVTLKKNPKENANVINKLCYWWLARICYKGATHTLESEDLYEPVHSERSEVLGDELEREWNKELKKTRICQSTKLKQKRPYEPSLLRCISNIYLWSFSYQGILMFIQNIICLNLRTIFFGQLITYFNPGSIMTKEQAYCYAVGLVGTTIVSILLGNQSHLETSRIGMKIRIACSSLVYRKILKLSKTSLDQTASGQIVNILSNDMQKLEVVPISFHYIWITPIQVAVSCYLIWQDIGIITVAGIATCMLQTIPLHVYISKLSVQLRKKIAEQTDKRVQMMNELISGIQVVKMYGWEKAFERIVNSVRAVEMKLVAMACYYRIIGLNNLVFTSQLTMFVTLLTLVFSEMDINTKTVFTTLTYWKTLIHFIAIYFPAAIVNAGDAHVSFRRIEEYLQLEEQKPVEHKDSFPNVNSSNDRNGVDISKLSANWIYGALPPTLNDISLKVNPGQLCALVGSVGSGKSSLLQFILREVPTSTGTLSIGGNTVSYASQEPWIFGGTVRDNILFGLPYVQKKYDKVTKVCALNRDFQQFSQGDLTLVGDRGVTLSGGQRARINLARAIYRDADIYLLDDPLSAVDSHVGRQLFEQCINGYLQGKTKILVTHQLQYLKNADTIIVLKDGFVESQGTFESLMCNNSYFANLLNDFHVGKDEAEANEIHSLSRTQLRRSITSVNKSTNSKPEELEREEVVKGRMSFEVYKQYFEAGGSICLRLFVLLMMILAQVTASGVDYWVTFWTNQEQVKQGLNDADSSPNFSRCDNQMVQELPFFSNASDIAEHIEQGSFFTPTTSIAIYAGLISSCILLTTVGNALSIRLCVNSSKTLHNRMFENISQATMRFFDTNPSGRILNRFSKDIGSLDEILPKSMLEVILTLCMMFGSLSMIVASNYWLLIPALIFIAICYAMRGIYLSIAQCIIRLEGVGKSPVFSHVNYSLDGLLTIRSSKAQQRMIKKFDDLQNFHTSAASIGISAAHAFAFYVNALVAILIAAICFIFIILDDEGTMSGNVGLAISQSLGLTDMIQFVLKKSVQIVGEMISAERVLQYTGLPKEGPFDSNDTNRPPSTWPEFGSIDIQNLSIKYAEEKPAVLKNINIHISHGQKIGIVGRTGAGKSSLVAALFRLAKIEGSLKIDGVDIQRIGLRDLRSKISIIPQEPTLFKGTLRYNLDPFNELSDDYLWAALGEVELRNSFPSLDYEVNDGGRNLSLGERQLVCVARAILKNNKIVVLDEATANIDSRTDALIQETIKRKFSNCTILTIAHRLSTIIDYDRVLVLDAGCVVEFDEPYKLLKKPDGHFTRMVVETGNLIAAKMTNAER